jgi:hypothetical protein
MVEVGVAMLVGGVDAMVGEAKLEDVVEINAANKVSAKEIDLGSWERITTRVHWSRVDCLHKAIGEG